MTFEEVLKYKPSYVTVEQIKLTIWDLLSGTKAKYNSTDHIIYVDLYNQNLSNTHSLLHEICHSLTVHDNWKPNNPDHVVLAEYAAERMLRNICRNENWGEILRESDRMILNRNNLPAGHRIGYEMIYYKEIYYFKEVETCLEKSLKLEMV